MLENENSYDAAWNLNCRTNNGATDVFAVDNKNQLTSTPRSNNIQYDDNGNSVYYELLTGEEDFAFDDENRLTDWLRLATADPDIWTQFHYDGLGRLRERVEFAWDGLNWDVQSDTTYIYDGWRVIQERSGATPTVSYTRGNDLSSSIQGAGGIGGLLARSSGYSAGNFTTHNYYYADGNGNITHMLNSSQSMVAKYRYDPFGNTISSSGTLASANVYRFSSKEIHANSGMYYYGYRFYEPNLQRWINEDPLEEEGGINLFSFVFNDPADFIDPLGLAGDINLGQGYTCRVDSFNTGASASHEIHVYNGAAEVGVFGPGGWINKHGFTGGPTLPPDVANKLNGVSVNAMRQQGMVPPKGMGNIKGLRGRLGRPGGGGARLIPLLLPSFEVDADLLGPNSQMPRNWRSKLVCR